MNKPRPAIGLGFELGAAVLLGLWLYTVVGGQLIAKRTVADNESFWVPPAPSTFSLQRKHPRRNARRSNSTRRATPRPFRHPG